ncbi:SPFH domain-containing protein [Planctobacterium marinum]
MNLVNIVLTVIILVFLLFSVVITRQKTLKHIVFLGKYWRTASPGLSFKIPFLSWVDKVSDTNIKEIEVPLRLKTRDQVTFSISLKVFYKVVENTSEAFKSAYNLDYFEHQIVSIATDSAIPVANNVLLEDIFNAKEKILDEAKLRLSDYFINYGVEIEKVVADEPQLPQEVEESANAVIAARRLNDAARFKADAIKTEKVGEATADGESVSIRMKRVGDARKAYAETTADAVKILVESGVDANTALQFLSRVGEQDALVTASRNSDTAIINTGGQTNISEIASMLSALNRKESAEE